MAASEPTKHQVSVIRGDEIARAFRELLGDDYIGDLHSNVVDAIGDLLHFAACELGFDSVDEVLRSADSHFQAEWDLHVAGEPADVTNGLVDAGGVF